MTKEWHRVSNWLCEGSRLIGNSKRKKEHIFFDKEQCTIWNPRLPGFCVSLNYWGLNQLLRTMKQWKSTEGESVPLSTTKVRSKEYYGSNTYNIVQYLLRSATWKCRLLRCLVIPNNSCKMLQVLKSNQVCWGLHNRQLCAPHVTLAAGGCRLARFRGSVRWMRRGASQRTSSPAIWQTLDQASNGPAHEKELVEGIPKMELTRMDSKQT